MSSSTSPCIFILKICLVNSDLGFRGDVLIFLYKYMRETDQAPWRPSFLTNQICFSYFCRRLHSDHFFQIVFKSDHCFRGEAVTALRSPLGSHVFYGSNSTLVNVYFDLVVFTRIAGTCMAIYVSI